MWWLGFFEMKRCGCEGEVMGLCPIYIGEKMRINGKGEFLRSPPWPSLLLHDFFFFIFWVRAAWFDRCPRADPDWVFVGIGWGPVDGHGNSKA